MDYYKTKYGRVILDPHQPLLVHEDKKKGDKVLLIPEFCFLTGLTDEMRSNFNTMKSLAVITKGSANEKMKDCIKLVNMFLENEKCRQDISDWGLTLENTPTAIFGRRLDAGNIQMGKSNFSIDQTDDIDRKIQCEMFSQPEIKKWMVFSTAKDAQATDVLMTTLQQVQKSFNYRLSPPVSIIVKGTQFRDWEEAISNNIKQDCQVVVLVIPGAKGKGFIYNDVKRLLCCKYPMPSQVILSSTLTKPKGVRSVINKVLIQICAKVGGEPWAVDKFPFTGAPTMVVGIDVYNKNGKSIIGCCGTTNRTFTKYVSVCKTEDQGLDISGKIAECLIEVSAHFAKINGIAPQHIIVLRDGVAPTQIKHTSEVEVKGVERILENVKLTYVLLNKKTNLKVFKVDENAFNNIPPGTLVDETVTDRDSYDFFLISQKTNQGLSQATHYNIIYDSAKVAPEEIHSFIYKLCYLYYNWTGGIKIPAPCQYAKKLAFLVGDKLSTMKEPSVIPGERFNNEIRSLYFL
jgi:aubergine-like protein